MKKSLITFSVTIIILVIVFLGYKIITPMLRSCESIFQQTSLSLGSKLEVIKTKGEIFIGEEKIQDLTERSQMMALNLKTCCIVLDGGKVNSDEFLKCKDSVKTYETQIAKVVTEINEAQVEKQEGKTEVVIEKVNLINQNINVAKEVQKNFASRLQSFKLPKQQKQQRRKKPLKAVVSKNLTIPFSWLTHFQ